MEGGSYMKSTLFDEKGHLSIETIEKLKAGSLNDDEMILVSEHLCDCESCANCLANSFEDNELVDAPLGFEDEVQSKIESKKQVKREFILYSFKIGVAVCIALMFVFSNVFNIVTNSQIKKYTNISKINVANSINTKLTNFSEKVVNMEVFKHEK